MAEACSAVPIVSDDAIEDTETFTITIDAGQDHVVVGSPNVVTVSIIDSTCKFLLSIYTFPKNVDLL